MKVRTQQYSEGLRTMKCNSAMIVNHFNKPYLALEIPEREMIDWLKVNETRLPMDIDIKIKRKKRSVDANSYCWVLCDKIAQAVGITKEEVYRKHIHDVGVFDDIAISKNATEDFIKNFESNGTGWIAEIQPCKLKGCNKVRCYYGSSTYDSKQMSRLIDSLVDDAKSYGIETLTPIELERMNELWNTK